MQIKKKVVPSQGIEPRFPGRKSGVLPLYYVGQVHQIKVGQSPPEMPKHVARRLLTITNRMMSGSGKYARRLKNRQTTFFAMLVGYPSAK